MSKTAIIPTIFLTGATGLVGRYLLKELLARGERVAVLTRAEANASAAQRIEHVLKDFESDAFLPRPKIISGDLTGEGLGISKLDRAWLKAQALTVVHCAASIRFLEDKRSGEPYRTNVDGTRYLIETLRELNVIRVHYVSTAYVGSRNTGAVVAEVPVLDESGAGNDYEKSKIRAEALLWDSPWAKSLTIHRPSIVIGDSQTGYTSTYHGFYAPLQIGAQFARAFGFSSKAGSWLRGQLGLQAEDAKNLVPVDWVARCIVDVACSRSGVESNAAHVDLPRVLHWTNPTPLTCDTMQAAIVDALETHFGNTPARADLEITELPTVFREQMGVYESYFHNDPAFDDTQSRRSQPNCPCPKVDYATLRKAADFALERNFGWPRSQPTKLPFADLRAVLEGFPPSVQPGDPKLGVCLLGPGAPEPLSFSRVGEQWQVTYDWPFASAVVLTLPMEVLSDCISGKIGLLDVIGTGRATISGLTQPDWKASLMDWLEHVKSRFEHQ